MGIPATLTPFTVSSANYMVNPGGAPMDAYGFGAGIDDVGMCCYIIRDIITGRRYPGEDSVGPCIQRGCL